jgi:hypothetical protein
MHELPGMGPEILLILVRQRVCALRVGTFIIDLEPRVDAPSLGGKDEACTATIGLRDQCRGFVTFSRRKAHQI